MITCDLQMLGLLDAELSEKADADYSYLTPMP